MKLKLAQTQSDFFRIVRIRTAVFVEEQHVDIKIEQDAQDDTALHWLVEDDDGQAIACCRGLAEGEAKLMEDFVKKYKAEALGVGEVALPGQAGNAKEEGKAKDASSAAEKPPETTNGALESTPTVGLYVSPAWRDGCFWGVQSQLKNQCQRGAHGNCPCLIGCSAPTCPSAGTPMQSR